MSKNLHVDEAAIFSSLNENLSSEECEFLKLQLNILLLPLILQPGTMHKLGGEQKE